MPEWGYSKTIIDPETTAKASGRELRVSPKHAREVCKTVKNMRLDQAKEYLNLVIEKKKPIPYGRHKKKVGHRHGLRKPPSGRYPVKAAQNILRILESAEANAEFKGLDTERLKIVHASAFPGMKIRKYKPRAFGRMTPYFETLCHVELILEQMEIT